MAVATRNIQAHGCAGSHSRGPVPYLQELSNNDIWFMCLRLKLGSLPKKELWTN